MSPDRKVSRPENSNASALDSESEDEDEEEEEEEGEGEVDDGGGGEEGLSSDDEEGERCPICLLRLRLQPVGRPQPCQHLFCLVFHPYLNSMKSDKLMNLVNPHLCLGLHLGVGESDPQLSHRPD